MMNEASGESEIRLNAYISKSGVASRRAADGFILDGRVKLNGAVVRELGTKVRQGDVVEFDGKPIFLEKEFHYIALNKPPGYLCSSSDPQGRPLARDLLPDVMERLYTVGRLDFFSSGLIIFTNDGNFAAIVGHPSTAPEKEYYVETSNELDPVLLNRFEKGITIEGIRYKAAMAIALGPGAARIVLVEGKNREIRRVLSAFGIKPKVLRRTRIGSVVLGSLPEGRHRRLSEAEVLSLRGPKAR
jgi:23S rRNA pseudouridine2605 synthase